MFQTETDQDRRHDRTLKHYLRGIAGHRLLDRAGEAALARRIRAGDQDALDRLVNANLRFVVSVAKGFLGRGLALMDLIAEGNVGLITAARRFDERRGHRFVTYAVWWIRQNIQAALRDQTRTVRLPANRVRDARRIARAERALVQRRRSAVADDELAARLDLHPADVARIRAAARPNLPLDEAPGEGRPSPADLLPDERGTPAPRRLEQRALAATLGDALAALEARERFILERYYGLGNAPALSLEAIGAQLGLSRERVRQLRNRACARIREGARGGALGEWL